MEKDTDKALNLAREYISIPDNKINIIKHCCKSLLYHNEDLWVKKKKGASGNFDNPTGSLMVLNCPIYKVLIVVQSQ